ncbi:MAG: PspA/IM30 family protein [Cohaesibacter sp.]|nr:PspA/IM30 family protein [Cohaesibacter sp.]
MSKLISTVKAAIFGSLEGKTASIAHLALEQQTREAGQQVLMARKAVALAKAQHEQDGRRLEKILADISDLEDRARIALEKEQDALARDAAIAIASLEDERDGLQKSITAFEEDLAILLTNLRQLEIRLRTLQRGQRVAKVRKTVQTAGNVIELSTLSEAEQTLSDIQERQERQELAEQAFKTLSVTERSDELIKRLSDAGCGSCVHTSVDAVLERLKQPKS